MLKDAPALRQVWENFCNWTNKFNYGKSRWTAPIKAGYNNNNYDDIILNRICGYEPYNFGPWDKEYQTEALFSPIFNIDLMKIVWIWMENNPNIKSISFDSMREFMGMSDEHAHKADFDVAQEAELLIKFLKLTRHYSPKVKFKGAFGVVKEAKDA